MRCCVRTARRWVFALLIALALPVALSPSASAAPVRVHSSETLVGTLVQGGPGASSGAGAPLVRLHGASRSIYKRQKLEAATKAERRLHESAPGGSGTSHGSSAETSGGLTNAGSGIAAAVFGSLNEPGLSAAQQLEAFPAQNVTPPDSTGAIGPNDYVEMVNEEIAVYGRSNLALIGSPVSFSSFTGGTSPCDPQIKYDPVSERWFAVAIRCDGTTSANAVYIDFSKTSDPSSLSTGWCRYSVSSAGSLEDYPKLGLSSNHIIIGANEFTVKPEAFNSARIFSIPKPAKGAISTCPEKLSISAFGSSTSPLKTSVEGHLALTPQPATETDSGASGYVVAADESSGFGSAGSHIMIWQLGGTAESPTLTALGAPAVSAFEAPPDVPQPGVAKGEGVANEIDTLDGRLTQAVAATDPAVGAEAIWTQQTVGGGGGSVVRWYELVPGTLEKRQSGTISETSNFVFNGAIAPTPSGGAVIIYNTGGASQKVQLWAQSRPASSPLGSMGSPVSLATSSAIDSDFTCPSPESGCRWGDYAGLSVDPSNSSLVWGSSQVNGPTAASNAAQWATRNFALAVSGEGDPIFYSNNVRITSAKVGFLAFGPIKFASAALGAEWECANVGFGSIDNEGAPLIGKGQVLSWGAQGNATAAGVEARRSCSFKKTGVEGEPEAWITDEPAVETTRKAPLSVPWNLQLTCMEREGVQSVLVRIGIPGGAPTTTGCRSEAEEATALAKEEEERKGCYATAVPEGCVKLDMIAPSLGLEAVFEGTVLPRIVNGIANGLHPSVWELTGGLAKLHLQGGFTSTALASGAPKMIGFAGEQLIVGR
jgi:hypothetical protein